MDELGAFFVLVLFGFIGWMIFITVKLVGLSKQMRGFGLTMLDLMEQFSKRMERIAREQAERSGEAAPQARPAPAAARAIRPEGSSLAVTPNLTGQPFSESPATDFSATLDAPSVPAEPKPDAAINTAPDEAESVAAPAEAAPAGVPAHSGADSGAARAEVSEVTRQGMPEVSPADATNAKTAPAEETPPIKSAQLEAAPGPGSPLAAAGTEEVAELDPSGMADTSHTPVEPLGQTAAATDSYTDFSRRNELETGESSQPFGESDFAPGHSSHANEADRTEFSRTAAVYADDEPEESRADNLMPHIRKFIKEGNFWVAGGVLMLLLGFAFLLTYMAERGIFSIEMRIATAAATGLAMVVLGVFLRNRKPTYALIMQGGGIGVMYLAVFAAAKLTTLFSPAVALILMTLLVVPGVALAVLQSAQVLAIFSFLGGFAAPILLSDGSGNYVALFSYYSLLNLGLLAITRFKLWRWLNLLGAFCTFVVMTYWCQTSYELSQFIPLQPFLIGFTLIFTLITLLSARRRQFQLSQPADALLAAGVPLVASFLQFTLAYELPHGLSLSALGYGTFYLGLAVFIWKRWGRLMLEQEGGVPEDAPASQTGSIRLLAELYLACGVILANLAIPLEFSQRITSAAWSLEGVVLFYLAYRVLSPRIKILGLTALSVGMVAAWLDLFTQRDLVGDYKIISSCICGLAFLVAASIQHLDVLRHNERELEEPLNSASGLHCEKILAVSGFFVWFMGLFIEASYMSPAPLNFLLLTVSVSALLFCLAGKRLNFRTLYLAAFLPLPMSVVCVLGGVFFSSSLYYGFTYYANFDSQHPVLWYLLLHNFLAGYGWLSWLVFAVCQGAFFRYAGMEGERASEFLRQAGKVSTRRAPEEGARQAFEPGRRGSAAETGRLYGLGLCLFALELIYVLTCSLRALVADTSHYTLAWADLAGISPALVYVIAMLWLNSRKAGSPMRLSIRNTGILLGTVPGLLFIGLGIWFGMGLFDAGNPYPLPFYIPVLNPLELQQAFCMAIFAVWQKTLHDAVRERGVLSAGGAELAEAAFGGGRMAARAKRTLYFWALSQPRLILVMSILLFAWLHSILFRSIHSFTGTPMNRVWDHEAFQALLTALWGMWGLLHIIIGNKKRTRLLWIIGAVLMLAVTAKIFMIDLADKGTLFRIVSFFIMGGIFLIIGWLAPLPPSGKKEAALNSDSDSNPAGKAVVRPDAEDPDTVYCTRQYSPLSPKDGE